MLAAELAESYEGLLDILEDVVARNIELAIEAVMRVVDLIPQQSSATVSAASEEEFGTQALTDLDDLLQESAGDITEHGPITAGIRITVPMIQHDSL